MYDTFLKEGSVSFDIGAYIGERTSMFLALGCRRVISVEARSEYSSRLHKKYEYDDRVIVIGKAVGSKNGVGTLKVHKSNWPDGSPMDSALSTMSREWLSGIDERVDQWDSEYGHPDWIHRSIEWSEEQPVEIVTLDSLIDEYGEPDFIKIDVEGWEREVIKGLTRPIKIISFEFNTLLKLEWAEEVINHLLKLGSYKFKYTTNDDLILSPSWLSKEELLEELKTQKIHGDIFAALL